MKKLREQDLGKTVLFTVREAFTDAEIVKAYRSTWHIESSFKQIDYYHFTFNLRYSIYCSAYIMVSCSLKWFFLYASVLAFFCGFSSIFSELIHYRQVLILFVLFLNLLDHFLNKRCCMLTGP